MRARNQLRPWLGLTACVLVAACSEAATRKIGKHVFAVPSANNVADNDAPFFLPHPNPSDGFSFILNPTAPLPDQVMVGVALKEGLCRRAAGTNAYVNTTACAPEGFKWRSRLLQKAGNAVFWNYVIAADKSQHGGSRAAVVVSCFQISDATRKGLCTANFPYSDLVLSLHLTDSRVPHIETLFDNAATKLRAWDHG